MIETVELRFEGEFAAEALGRNGSEMRGQVHVVEVLRNDYEYCHWRDAYRKALKDGRSVLYSWRIRRQYETQELELGTWFVVDCRQFEPTGEACGTTYDDASACAWCGTDAKQSSDLILDISRLPRGVHVARTIGNEWVISSSLSHALVSGNITGIQLRPVWQRGYGPERPYDIATLSTGRRALVEAQKAGFGDSYVWVWLTAPTNQAICHAICKDIEDSTGSDKIHLETQWYQLTPGNVLCDIVPPSMAGINPFNVDEEGEYRCIHCDLAGLARLSEVFCTVPKIESANALWSRQFYGVRRGVLRPRRELLVNRNMYQILRAFSRGLTIELARLV
jgi:hypothetical protein